MGQKIGSMAVGSTVKIKENGTPQEYIIIHHGNPDPSLYDASCNGTWLMRKLLSNTQTSYYSGTDEIDFWSNGATVKDLPEILAQFPADIQNAIKTVKIPYVFRVISRGNADIRTLGNGYSCKLFLLSSYELGQTKTGKDYIDGAPLSYFNGYTDSKRIAYDRNGYAGPYWTRTPGYDYNFTDINRVIDSGKIQMWHYQGDSNNPGPQKTRQAMIVPDNLIVDDSGNLTAVSLIAPTLSAPVSAMVGTKINLSWTTSEGATQYILERNTGSGWSSVYTGPNTSFEDTVGSWSTVQYRVAASDGTNKSDYGMSSAITVISADALVISGEDSYLGVLKSDVVYSVNTDTGNQITLERKVNDVTIATITVDNGFAYSIPVMDLPSGYGTITLTASVQASSGKVSKTRTWTYNKEALTFPMDADIAAYQHNGRTIYPATIAEAVRTPTVMGGSLDKTLELIAPIIGSSVVAAGTYTGTGQFGPDHPNVIDLGAEALVVTIYGDGKTLVISNTSSGSPGVISGTTCTWYSDVSAEEQLNKLDTLYSYVAVMTTK